MAEYWLQACRSLSLNQIDCAMALVRLHLSVGNLDHATKLLVQILQTERKDRIMLNHFRLSDCDLPVYIMEMFGYNTVTDRTKSNQFFNDANHAKYALMAVSIELVENLSLFF